MRRSSSVAGSSTDTCRAKHAPCCHLFTRRLNTSWCPLSYSNTLAVAHTANAKTHRCPLPDHPESWLSMDVSQHEDLLQR